MSSVSGDLRSTSVADLVQMSCMSQRSCNILVTTAHHKGIIVIEVGNVIHARWGSEKGEKAFTSILSLRNGNYKLEDECSNLQRSINKDWHTLLLDCAVAADESARQRERRKAPLSDYVAPLNGLFVAAELNEENRTVEQVGPCDASQLPQMRQFFQPVAEYFGTIFNLGTSKAMMCGGKQILYMQRTINKSTIGSYFDPRFGSGKPFRNFAKSTKEMEKLRSSV